MLALDDGLMLFHGSYTEVKTPDLEKCRPGKDFGRGFYLTTSLEQARSFSRLSARKHNRLAAGEGTGEAGVVSAFRFSASKELAFFSFEHADEEWLHFVAANRRTGLFADQIAAFANYDVIAGKIANDQTARTLQLYVSGAYGNPGSPQADGIAVSVLLPNRLENQYCFRSARALSSLQFVESSVCHG